MIEKFEIEEVNMLQVLKSTTIKLDEELPPPPVAISIGNYIYRNELMPKQFGTYGNFSCIVGASKSKKTFLKSALLAGYIGGKSQNYFSEIRGHNTEDKYVIDIDTEQGKWDAQRVSRRVIDMVGAKYPFYKPYFLREQPPNIRMQFIEYLVNEVFKNKVGILSIDGAADLIEDVNDLKESNEIVQKLMKLSSENNIHIITVIHRNFGTDKPTGHLGSAILKKAETVTFVESENKIVKVKARHTRSFPFDDFVFSINENGLPYQTQEENHFI